MPGSTGNHAVAEPAQKAWSVDAFFAWQGQQPERFELVGGLPLKMMAGTRNVHDDIVVNVLAELRRQLRGAPCRPFTADGSIETPPGQIRRPGIDRGRRDPNGFKAAEPFPVLKVLSPGTRDFDTFEKLGEYRTVGSLDHLVFVEPDLPMVVHRTRGADRGWTRRSAEGLDASLAFPELGITLALAEVDDRVEFPPRLGPL